MNTSSPSSTQPDILDIYIPEPPPNYLAMALWIGLAIVVVAAIAWALFHFIRKDKLRRSQGASPRSIALSRMTRLESEASGMAPHQFGLRLSDIIKDYLHARYGDRFRFQTAEEFLARFHDPGATGLPPVTNQSLASFVGLCEELKFGRPGDASQRCQPLLNEGRRIVHDRPEPAPSTGPESTVTPASENHASTTPAAR